MQLEQAHVDGLTRVLEEINTSLKVLAGYLHRPRYRQHGQGVENGSGVCTIPFRIEPGGQERIAAVRKVFAYTNSTGTPEVGIFIMDSKPHEPLSAATAIDPLYQVDASNIAIVAGEEQEPLVVKGGQYIFFQWTGLSTGAVCKCSIQYTIEWQGP